MNLEVMNDLGHIVNQLIELGSSAGCTLIKAFAANSVRPVL